MRGIELLLLVAYLFGVTVAEIVMDVADNSTFEITDSRSPIDATSINDRRLNSNRIPSKLKATIRFGYTEALKDWLLVNGMEKFGTTDFDTWMKDVLVVAQRRFSHPSLGTEIVFEVFGDSVYEEGFAVDDTNFGKTTPINRTNLDIMSWWQLKDKGMCGGLGELGALCTGINWMHYCPWQSTESTGSILGHELMHNFGVREGSMWKNCKEEVNWVDGKVGGVYALPGIAWTSCSRRDFENEFVNDMWGCGCLEDISTAKTSSAATPSSGCPEGHVAYRNNCYFTSFENTNPAGKKTWGEARKYCMALSDKYPSYDYDLVSLRDKDEYDFILNTEWSDVYKTWKEQFSIWIGLNDIQSEGQWKWSDCSKLDYEEATTTFENPPWMPGEPNAVHWGEDCARTKGLQGLMDDYCEEVMPFICKGRPVKV